MAPADLERLLERTVTLAHRASNLILEVYESDFDVGRKQDESPLTAADLASHHCIVEGLGNLEPAFPVISEECSELPFEQRRQWETFWLVDPLDGTREFIKRNGEFTVNIALIHRHEPILGVVDIPAKGQCYYAARGMGAFKQSGDASPRPITVRRPAPSPITVAGSRSHGSREMERYLARLDHPILLSVGSSLKFCLVAEGSADLYPRLGPTSEWDTAAAQCIVEEAGGHVIQLNGEKLRYNTKASYLNPFFLVFADDSRDWTAYARD